MRASLQANSALPETRGKDEILQERKMALGILQNLCEIEVQLIYAHMRIGKRERLARGADEMVRLMEKIYGRDYGRQGYGH